MVKWLYVIKEKDNNKQKQKQKVFISPERFSESVFSFSLAKYDIFDSQVQSPLVH